MSSDDSFGAFIFGAVILYFLVSPFYSKEETTVYYKYCPDFEHNGYSCPEPTKLMEMKYKVSFDTQIVVSQGAYAHKNCTVFDKENWECRTSNTDYISMRDGDIYESGGSLDEKGQKTILPRYTQIPRLAYNIKMVLDWFR